MNDCIKIPKVRNERGLVVPSDLYLTLMNYSDDKILLNSIYAYTKTQAFRDEQPLLDFNDEPQIYYLEPDEIGGDGQPVFLFNKDGKGTYRQVFKNNTKFRQLTKEIITEKLLRNKVMDEYNNLPTPKTMNGVPANYMDMTDLTREKYDWITKFNAAYKEAYHLREDLVYVRPKGSRWKVFINQDALDAINEMRNQRKRENMSLSPFVDTNDTTPKGYQDALRGLYLKKKDLLRIYDTRIKTINNNLLKLQADKKLSKEEIEIQKKLYRKEIYRLKSEEKKHEEELKKLEKILNITGKIPMNALAIYGESVLDLMENLAKSNDKDDIEKAREIARFFENAGSLDYNENQLFSPDELKSLSDTDKEVLANWLQRSISTKALLNNKGSETWANDINSIAQIKHLYGRKLTHDEIVHLTGEKGLEDIGVVDMMVMDATNGIFSSNGIIPQISSIVMNDIKSRNRAVIRHYGERITSLLPKVEAFLDTYEGGKYKYKIKGLHSWELFYQKDFGNQLKRNLIQRYAPNWTYAYKEMLYKYGVEQAKINNAYVGTASKVNAYQRLQAIAKNNEMRRKWMQKHVQVLNFMQIAELNRFVKEHEILSQMQFATIENQIFLTAESLGISEFHYQELIAEQKSLLEEFAAKYNVELESVLNKEQVAEFKDLSQKAKAHLISVVKENSPWHGYKNWESESMDHPTFRVVASNNQAYIVYNSFEYNVFIPNKTVNGKESGYWDNQFDVFEKNEDLYKLRQVFEESLDYINQTIASKKGMRYKEGNASILDLRRDLWDILLDHSDETLATRLHEAWTYILDKLKEAVRVIESHGSDAQYDLLGNEKMQISNTKIVSNSEKVNRDFLFEMNRFVARLGSGVFDKTKSGKLKLNEYVTINEKNLTPETLDILLSYQQVRTLDELKSKLNITGTRIPVGRIIKNYVEDKIVRESNMNLPLAIMSYLELAAEYNARVEAFPHMKVFLDHYRNIKAIKTSNIRTPLLNKNEELRSDGSYRTNAIKQYESQFKRDVLGNYDGKEFGGFGNMVYTSEEKETMKKIDQELAFVDDEERSKHLIAMRNSLGGKKHASKILQIVLDIIRLKGLGWSIPSSLTNLTEGHLANEYTAARTSFFTQEEWLRAKAINHEFVIRKKSRDVKLVHKLLTRYDVLIDAQNEFQKSRKHLSRFNMVKPYNLVTVVEEMNQSPLMTALLLHEKIKGVDSNGNEVESSVWDAFDDAGKLKPEFRSELNINNWENMDGEQYQLFKTRMEKLNITTHGDFIRGMLLKENIWGRASIMYKTWLPRLLYSRIGSMQHDIELAELDENGMPTGIKGMYRSHTTMSAGLHGSAIGLLLAGPLGLAVGFGTGMFLGNLNDLTHTVNGMNESPSYTNKLQELGTYVKIISKKMMGLPINTVMGKEVIKIDGVYTQLRGQGFSALDARNMEANLTEIAVLLMLTAGTLIAKALLWDDDDDETALRRQLHNLLVNRLMSLAQQSIIYAVAPQMKESVQNIALFTFATDVIKIAGDVNGFVSGHDVVLNGPNRGDSKLTSDLQRTFIPSLFRTNPLTLGFEKEMQKEYTKFDTTVQDWLFKSKEDTERTDRLEERAIRDKELRNEGVIDKEERQQILDSEFSN